MYSSMHGNVQVSQEVKEGEPTYVFFQNQHIKLMFDEKSRVVLGPQEQPT